MKRSIPVVALALALVAGAAIAGPIHIEVPTSIEPTESGLTRAEVIADYHMWRLAGLQDLTRGERSVDTNSYAYRKAYATYAHLRQSPQYAALVSELQRNRFANVVASRGANPEAHAAK
jgi:hypothetical protein